MDYYCGIDLGCKETALCVIDQNRKVVREVRLATCPEELAKALKGLKGVRCLIETAPLAEWCAKTLEVLGHNVSLVCARKAKQAMTSQKKKTDRRDAHALAELCRSGWYEPVHRKSEAARNMRSYLTARKQLVESGNAIASSMRGILRAHGIKLACATDEADFSQRVKAAAAKLDKQVQSAILEMLRAFELLHSQQRRMYRDLDKATKLEGPAKLLKTAHGVGAATAAAYVATIDDPQRFSDGEKVAAYLGLVPSVYQSGETEYRGRITKNGDKLLRWLLVEAANIILTRSKKDSELRRWGLRLAETKGYGKARVAVARRLCGILLRMWKDGEAYRSEQLKVAA